MKTQKHEDETTTVTASYKTISSALQNIMLGDNIPTINGMENANGKYTDIYDIDCIQR